MHEARDAFAQNHAEAAMDTHSGFTSRVPQLLRMRHEECRHEVASSEARDTYDVNGESLDKLFVHFH